MGPPAVDQTTVRAWLALGRTGCLSTVLAAGPSELQGFPFGSVVPYVLDEAGSPLVWLSQLAVHTKNLELDPRASLLVSEPGAADVQAGWRVTCVGRMHKLEGDEATRALACLRSVHPAPDLPGFASWRLTVERARAIAGFGAMGWV